MSGPESGLIVDTTLTAARFLGEVTVTRDDDTLTVAGLRPPAALHRLREVFGGLSLLGGMTTLVLAAAFASAIMLGLAAALLLAALVVYGAGYLLLFWWARQESVSFAQSAIQGLEVHAGPRPWSLGLPGGRHERRLSFNVVDERFRATPYEFLLADDEQLVELAGLLARDEGRRQAGTVRVR